MVRLKRNQLRSLVKILLFTLLNLELNAIQAASFQKTSQGIQKDTRAGRSCQKICQTDSCRREAQIFLDTMDFTIDPCDNFYQFACGKFKNIPIPEDSDHYDYIEIMLKETIKALRSLLPEEIRPDELDAFKKVKMHFQNCMDDSQRDPDKVLEFIHKTGGFPILVGNKWNESGYDWKKHVYRIFENNFLMPFPLNIDGIRDPDDNTKALITVKRTPNILLQILNQEDLESYSNELSAKVEIFGVDKNTIREEIKELANFQQELFKIHSEKSKVQQRRITFGELSQKYPGTPWLEIVNQFFKAGGLVSNDSHTIIIKHLEIVAKSYEYINKAPKRVVANQIGYLVLQLIDSLILNWRSIKSHDSVKTDTEEDSKETKRQNGCVKETREKLKHAFNSMYVRKYFNEATRVKVREMYENIKKQMKKNLQQVDWLDDETRKNALEKLDAIRVYIGHADELLNDKILNAYYQKLIVRQGSYIESYLNVSSFSFHKAVYDNIAEPVDKYHWTNLWVPYDVNAIYTWSTNTIVITVAYIQEMVFQLDRPSYLNYGALGMTAGHEITHPFDSFGQLYDKNGNINNWWDNETKKKFWKKTECIKKQYSQLIEPEYYYRVNGSLTLSENIADNGGYKLSYRSYSDWIEFNKINEPCLPNLTLIPRQLFWLSAARLWCFKGTRDYVKKKIESDVHAPYSVRVNGGLRNMKEFAEDFKCAVGTRMNPSEKCSVW